jgi:hypothetical protein
VQYRAQAEQRSRESERPRFAQMLGLAIKVRIFLILALNAVFKKT